MLLSSVNFVAKPKHGKVKVKDEHKSSPPPVQPDIDEECEQCKIEAKRSRTYFQFPSVRASSADSFRESGYASLGESSESVSQSATYPRGDRVTIGTGDEYCISVDPFFYTICMADESRCDSTCIFRKRILQSEERANGRTETVVFHLDCDRDHYLTTNKDRQLELNYCSEAPMRPTPDERFFHLYHTPLGQTFIQPFNHKGYYFHHRDDRLTVEQLDLNLRAPEEFYFYINFVPENSPLETQIKKCTHRQANNDQQTHTDDHKRSDGKTHKDTHKHTSNEQKTHKDAHKHTSSEQKTHTDNTTTHNTFKKPFFEFKLSPQIGPRSDCNMWKMRELINSKHKVQQNTYSKNNFFSQLFLGCFSARSHRYSQTEI